MKDTMDSAAVGEHVEKEGFSNRKLIRPTLPRMDQNSGNHNSIQNQAPERRPERLDRLERNDRPVPERPVHERAGNDRTGYERMGNERNGHERMNHDRSHDRPRHDGQGRERAGHERTERGGGERAFAGGKKSAPPEQTNAENFYYQKQMQGQTSMVIVLRDGEEIRGVIEWYDKNCIKVLRNGGHANLMIYKPAIKYMYKEGENQQ